jgi:hypothetical protein
VSAFFRGFVQPVLGQQLADLAEEVLRMALFYGQTGFGVLPADRLPGIPAA